MPVKPAEIRKALVALATFLTNLVALNVFPERYLPFVIAFVSALGVYGVYAVPNAGPEA